jgi:hypothetical protein
MAEKKFEPRYLDANGRPIKPKGQLSDATVKKITDVVKIMLKDKK